MRIIIFSGKGGSGVSTLAAATGAALAAGGKRTLVFGLSAGVGAALGAALGREPANVAKSLDGVECRSQKDTTDEFRDWLEDVLDFRNMDVELAADVSALPGFSHVGRLLELEALARSGNYEAIVVDGAPLGQFLELPGALEASARWLERLFAARQQTVFEPLLRVFAADQVSTGEEVFERGRTLLGRLAGLRDIFADSGTTTVRLVSGADGSAAGELQDAVTALSLFGYQADAACLNRLLPDDVDHPLFSNAQERQAKAIAEARASLPAPVLSAALRAAPPVGAKGLVELAADVYGDYEPAAVLHRSGEYAFQRSGDALELTMPLPFARRESIAIEQVDDGVMVHLNGYRRVIPLPADSRYFEATGWALEGGELKVTFRD
jgi:arsenite-transporting ATPase